MDSQAMLIAAVAALWGVVFALGRELRAMWMRTLEQCEARVTYREQRIAALEQAAASALVAKDSELSELRKLLIVQWRTREGLPPEGPLP